MSFMYARIKAKSRAVRELIELIHGSPELFRANKMDGFESEMFSITLSGNTRVLSIIRLKIDGKNFPLTYSDSWALEVAALWWFKNAPLKQYA